jgi:hypothetical protein
MKIKVVSNYDNDINIYKSVINCFGEDQTIKLTLQDDYDYLVVINGYDTKKINSTKNKIIGILQEPSGNINYDRNLHFYCSKIFCQSKNMFNSYKGIIETPVSMFYSGHVYKKREDFLNFHEFKNRKKLCIIMSAINSPNNSVWNNHNYTKRHELIKKMLNSDLDFDFYGRGWSIQDKRYKGEIVDKHDILRKYEYSIAIENVCEKNYASEKIFDCFLNNTIPIYYGCPNINELYNKNSYILLDIGSNDLINNIKAAIDQPNDLFENAILNSKKIYFEKYNIYNFIKEIS